MAQHYRDGADALRKQELRRLREELPEAQRDDLKHTLWPFRKRPEDLSVAEQERLKRLLGHSPALRRAYTLREELTRIFETARSKADGLRRLGFWRQRVARSGLTCFDAFLKLVDRWGDLIGNYFVHRQSSGFVEGLNTKLKVLKRRCYGLKHVGHLFQRLTLDARRLPSLQPLAHCSSRCPRQFLKRTHGLPTHRRHENGGTLTTTAGMKVVFA